MYDCDSLAWPELLQVCEAESAAQIDSFTTNMPYLGETGSVMDNPVFSSLLENDEFKTLFVETFTELADFVPNS